DTIVSSLDFQLPHLEKNTKYYWRVCGVNTEGESRWSDVWSFTTGTSADVHASNEDVSFSCYPNPTSSEMTITSPSPSSFTISNAAGQEIRKGLTMAGQTRIDVSALPSGVYFVRVTGEKQAKMIQILR
ncbi:MAG TPA: T9SS type A sorting domain-containing protein, partial [Candidatus Kapabacteria bacterium]